MKQDVMQEISVQLSALGLPVLASDKTDLAIDAELLDVAVLGGKKKLRYEAMILFDKGDKQVRMYEKTTEINVGVSFGMNAESSFQSGSTLMRKVTYIQIDPAGKTMEFHFDLGAISKSVKAAAAAHGWGFKTVILKKNAMFR